MKNACFRERLVGFLAEAVSIREPDLAGDSPLITSSLINSVALFGLALLVEEAIGRPLDLAQLNLPTDWDTLDRIVAFVERQAIAAS